MYDGPPSPINRRHRRNPNEQDYGFDDKQLQEYMVETELYSYERRSRKKKQRRAKHLKETATAIYLKQQSVVKQEREPPRAKKLSIRLRKEEPMQPMQPKLPYIKIPIEYFDEQANPNIHSKRLVYRGYMPRSSHYYLKTLKDVNYFYNATDHDVQKVSDLSFNSKFYSGNLNQVLRQSSTEYTLWLRYDTNTKGQRQWFFFEVYNRKPCRCRFRIYKFTKFFSLYRRGAKPFILTKSNHDWQQAGYNIRYDYDAYQRCYFLYFEFKFYEEASFTYFSSLPPYSYSKMMSFVKEISEKPFVYRRVLGYSLAGLEIPYLEIGQEEKYYSEKQFIVVLARTHPGETVSNFALESFIQVVLQPNNLLNKFIFIIVPMVNPDGVFVGNHRTGLLGQDLNRHFNTEDEEFFPYIVAVKNLVRATKKRGKIRFLFDLHGHSAKKDIFAYAGEYYRATARFLYNRIIPKILASRTTIFNYEECVFRNSREKKDTARVHFMQKERIIAVTFEQSYSQFTDYKLKKIQPIGINNWRNFGISLAYSLIEYLQLVDRCYDIPQRLKEYMPEYLMEPEKKELEPPTAYSQPLSQTTKSESSIFPNNYSNHQLATSSSMLIQPTKNIIYPLENIQYAPEDELYTEESDLELDKEEFYQFKKNIRQYLRPHHSPRMSIALAYKHMYLDYLEVYRMKNMRIHYIHRPSVPRIFRLQNSINLREKRSEMIRGSQLELPSINKRYF